MEDRGKQQRTDDDEPFIGEGCDVDREYGFVDEVHKLSGSYRSLEESTDTPFGPRPSIFWTGNPPEKFYIGYLLCHGWRWPRNQGLDDMLEYVAFMSTEGGLDVNLCLADIKDRENEFRAYYDEEFQTRLIKDKRYFQESLLVAGCFLYFALLSFAEFAPYDGRMYDKLRRKIEEDPTRTKLDMLNPKNQIPWPVVKIIFDRSHPNSNLQSGDQKIRQMSMKAFRDLHPSCMYHLEEHELGSNPDHVLHNFYMDRVPKGIMSSYSLVIKRIDELYIPNATELLGSAIVFKKLDKGQCEVYYSNKKISAEMQITTFHVFSYTRELYTHLLNFEWGGHGNLPVIGFLAIMKNLLRTTEDVKLLQNKGILINTLPGEEDILILMQDIWKKFGQEAIIGIPMELYDLSYQIKRHFESRVTIAYTGLKRQYCPNRWVGISIFAAFLLFGLTIIQTIYSVLGYYKT